MIITRSASECGQADYGWLKARYTFSFGHYFDSDFLGYASLRVLNQEVLAAGASLQPRTLPRVDILNLVLDGQASYRDSEGNETQANVGEAIMLSARPDIHYSEHNLSQTDPLIRMQLWLDTHPTCNNPTVQKITLASHAHQLMASPDGQDGSLQVRLQIRVH